MGRRKDKTPRRVLGKLYNPPNWVAWLAIATTIIVCPLIGVAIVVGEGEGSVLFALFGCLICVILLVYSTVVTVNSVIKIRKKVLIVADRYEFTRQLSKSYEYRTAIFGLCALLCNVGYTVFLIVMAFLYDSIWYGAVGVYYILLSITRGGILVQTKKDEKKYRYDYQGLQLAKAGTYRYCGIMVLTLAVSLIVSVIELVVGGSGFKMNAWLLYVFAAVAAYKTVSSVVHFIRATKRDDLAARAVRYVNLAVAVTSILCLQTAIVDAYLLKTTTAILLNGITGTVVCAITLALGVYMVVASVKEKRRLLAQEAVLAEAVELVDGVGYNRDGYGDEYEDIPEVVWEEVEGKIEEIKK